MRTLLLLRGAPGSGKSTWIKENGLENYSLELDKIRLMLSAPVLNTNGEFRISGKSDKEVIDLFHIILEKRMKNGDFTVIDATHSDNKALKKYKTLAEKYRYKIYYKEFNLSLEELYNRNNSRPEVDKVSTKVIDRMYTLVEKHKPQSFATKIEDLSEIVNYYVSDLTNKFENIKIIGDIQGCYTVLNEAIGDTLDENTMYIFAGDLLDRGIENKQVLQFMLSICTKPNVVFVEGNHDVHLRNWSKDSWELDKNGDVYIPFTFRETNEDIRTVSKKSTRKLTSKFRLAYAFEFHGRKYFVNHGGVSSLPNMTLISGEQLVRGVGNYNDEIDEMWEESFKQNRTQGFIQVHGHRKTTSTEHSICLEDGVEYGGNLVILNVTKDGHNIEKHKNTVFNRKKAETHSARKHWINDTANSITNSIIHNKNIKVKDLENNILSLNFTRDVFYNRSWDNITTKARGLFVHKKTGDIVMRSYNKFFNIEEMPETQIRTLKENIMFPLKAYNKYNGFLGIASTINEEFVLASKSTTSGPYKEMFADIFNTLSTNEKETLKNLAKVHNCSFVFEVLHINDKHIIDFTENTLVILDAIPNSYDINGVHIDVNFSEKILNEVIFESSNFKRKELVEKFEDIPTLMRYINANKDNNTTEGLVLEDRNGFLFKVKFEYYNNVKRLRTLKDRVVKKHNIDNSNVGKTALEVEFILWAQKQPLEYLEKTHIIDVYKKFEKENI